MPYYMYVALQEDDKISVFTIDPQTGKLTPQVEVPAPGGPFTMAISPDKKFLYVGCRDNPQLSSFQINQVNGGLTQNGTVPLDAWPVWYPRTATASSCCRPITREHVPRYTLLVMMDR